MLEKPNDESRDVNRDEELALTPGGLRKRNLVHRVASGESVQFDNEGNPIVISPKEGHDNTDTVKNE